MDLSHPTTRFPTDPGGNSAKELWNQSLTHQVCRQTSFPREYKKNPVRGNSESSCGPIMIHELFPLAPRLLSVATRVAVFQ